CWSCRRHYQGRPSHSPTAQPSLPHSPPPRIFLSPGTASTSIYTLSLHDALPILHRSHPSDLEDRLGQRIRSDPARRSGLARPLQDRKSTRLNSSHLGISYAVFCLKKKNLLPWALIRRLQLRGYAHRVEGRRHELG